MTATTKKFSLITEYAQTITSYAGWTSRTSREKIENTLLLVLQGMANDGLLKASEWSSLDSIWYGINSYVQTGRATVEIEKELATLTGNQLIRLIMKMWLDGVNVSGDVGVWLCKHQGAYARMIR